MEDAIVINAGSIERGLFRSDVFETYESNDDDAAGICLERPNFHAITNLQNANYQTVDHDGLPAAGQTISKRDVIVGRVSHHDSKFMKQAQQHAVQASAQEASSGSIPSVRKTTPFVGAISSSVKSSVSSSKAIHSSIHSSSSKIASSKSLVSEQSEQDMKTLREHLQWISTRDAQETETRQLAILENLTKTHSLTPPASGPPPKSGMHQKDHSIVMQKELFDQHMVVDRTLVTQNSEHADQRIVKVRLRQTRIPEVGDKLSSRHGQKGVIGRIMRPEDMPYTIDGQVADLIINPHCMPSRMTIGQLLESLSGKALVLDDRHEMPDANIQPCDSDSADYFGHGEVQVNASCCHRTLPKIRDYAQILRSKGYDVYGNEPMYDGATGKLLQSKDATGKTFINEAMFIGVVYYHRLRHMVADKLYARAKGSVQLTTRQPNEGRSAEGGLRLGEMERDVLVSHGATQVVRDRYLENSDRYDTVLCNHCGGFANKKSGTCSVCHDKADLRRVTIPYALKLLDQELASSGIYMQFSSQKDTADSIFHGSRSGDEATSGVRRGPRPERSGDGHCGAE